jgi:broad specificity phosphatase PhoE
MGPTTLLLVRHGESLGNLAAAAAVAGGSETIAVPARDPDVLLSDLGLAQAQALGRHLATLPVAERPDLVATSTYARARQTTATALATAGLDLPVRFDERLRDRELGVLDMLTALGVDRRLPFEAERRRWLGKFAYRPPGGESWNDLALRLRSFVRDLDAEPAARVLLVCHDAPIMVLRYILEALTEARVLELARLQPIRNATVTHLERSPGAAVWRAVAVDVADHLQGVGVPATTHPGTPDVSPADVSPGDVSRADLSRADLSRGPAGSPDVRR